MREREFLLDLQRAGVLRTFGPRRQRTGVASSQPAVMGDVGAFSAGRLQEAESRGERDRRGRRAVVGAWRLHLQESVWWYATRVRERREDPSPGRPARNQPFARRCSVIS